MDVGTSKGLESFLAFLRETTERHRMAEADRAEAEAATQDLLHALELGDDKAPGRARLGLKIREVRRQRRTAKDIAEQTRPVVDWVEQNRTVIKGLERLLLQGRGNPSPCLRRRKNSDDPEPALLYGEARASLQCGYKPAS